MENNYEIKIRELIHSLRNPLTAIMSNLELIHQGYMGKINSQVKEIIEETFFNVRYLDILMTNAGDIVKIKSKEELFCKQVNLAAVIESVQKEIRVIYKDYGDRIEVRTGKKYFILTINEDFLWRFLLMFILELIKFSQPGNKLLLTFDEDNTDIILSAEFSKETTDSIGAEDVFRELFIAPSQKSNRLNCDFFQKFTSLFNGSISIEKQTRKTVLNVKFKKNNI